MNSSPDPDDAILDELFGRFIADLSEGRSVDPAAARPDRPDLAERIRATFEIATKAVVRRPEGNPVIAGYEILAEIGRGGMGTVHLARDVRLGRRVAMKTIPSRALASRSARDRFEREARAVARLQHPSIVQVFDFGDDGGTPWFTMEWIEGRTLAAAIATLREAAAPNLDGPAFARVALGATDDEARAERFRGDWPGVVARIALDVAEALAHAHDRGVVHRDVKPANILLRRDGRAMLFDFGLADVESEHTLTRAGDFLGTPHYAAPEQISGQARDAGPAADVYALGVTLYEALTLELPFRGPTTQTVMQAVLGTEPAAPRSRFPGDSRDLGIVCLTAMEKDPSRRYASAAAMADDLRRVLERRPILARPVPWTTKALRFVQRHPTAAVAAALAFLLVVGTPTALLVQQRAANEDIRAERDRAGIARDEADRARAKAEQERDHVREGRDFLESILASVDPEGRGRGRDAKVVDVLLDAEKKLAESFRGDEETRAALEYALGGALDDIGYSDEARRLLARSASARERILGATHPDTLRVRLDLAYVLGAAGHQDESVRRIIEIRTDAAGLPRGDELRLVIAHDLGFALREAGRSEEAGDVLREVLPEAVEAAGDSGRITLRLRHNLALVEDDIGDAGTARVAMRAVWEARRAAFGERDSETLASLGALAQMAAESGNAEDADLAELLAEIVRIHREVHGPRHYGTLMHMHNLAGHRARQRRLDEALAIQDEVVREGRTVLEPGSADLLLFEKQRGILLAQLGRNEEAESVLRTVVESSRNLEGDEGLGTVVAESALAWIFLRRGATAEAEALLRGSIGVAERQGPEFVPVLGELLGQLAGVCERSGRAEEYSAIRERIALLGGTGD